MSPADRITCRTPNRPGQTRIPQWKFDAIRSAILAVLSEGDIRFTALAAAVGSRLSHSQRESLGSLSWHVITVKLELEVRREIARLPGRGPQMLTLVKAQQ